METHENFLSFKQVFPVQGITWPLITTLFFSPTHTKDINIVEMSVFIIISCSHSLSYRLHFHMQSLLISSQDISLNLNVSSDNITEQAELKAELLNNFYQKKKICIYIDLNLNLF